MYRCTVCGEQGLDVTPTFSPYGLGKCRCGNTQFRTDQPPPPEYDFYADSRDIQTKYDEWRASPDGEAVYANVRERAMRLRERGWKHFGIKALWEAARYDHALRVGPDAAGVKVNNNYTSRIARELMDNEPGLAGFFEVRILKS
jgi:hypothetical protein